MSAMRSADQCAPRHRQNLPRQRKSVRFEFRPGVYARLLELAGDGEPLVAVVERLILREKGCPKPRTEYVHEQRDALGRVA